jgi:hypothetical protein
MVEQQRGGQAQASGTTKTVPQLYGHERVEADLLERTGELEGVRCRKTKDRGRFGADEIEKNAVALGLREGGEALFERRWRAGTTRDMESGGCTDETLEQGWEGVSLCAQNSDVETRRNEECVRSAKGSVKEGEAVLGRERDNALARYTRDVGIVQMIGHAAALTPEAPGERASGEAMGPAAVRKRIKEGVGRCIVALARAAQHAGERREKYEGGEVLLFGELV